MHQPLLSTPDNYLSLTPVNIGDGDKHHLSIKCPRHVIGKPVNDHPTICRAVMGAAAATNQYYAESVVAVSYLAKSKVLDIFS
ncbi:hypothetical protein NPIL_523761 [Nephila pilipes]|uniref:Uncharacterized protein n=1 Tax=Nephila pilipes TaxID=299642 RepID=A0A8X6N2T8_NEPPI|nr:hypothetical protein NPIL_523761 [Nephila pilipes]